MILKTSLLHVHIHSQPQGDQGHQEVGGSSGSGKKNLRNIHVRSLRRISEEVQEGSQPHPISTDKYSGISGTQVYCGGIVDISFGSLE